MLSSRISRNRRPCRSDSRARSRLHARLRLPIAYTRECCSKSMAGAGRPNQRRLSEPLDGSVEWLRENQVMATRRVEEVTQRFRAHRLLALEAGIGPLQR